MRAALVAALLTPALLALSAGAAPAFPRGAYGGWSDAAQPAPRAHVFIGAGPARVPFLLRTDEGLGWDLVLGADVPLHDIVRGVARLRGDVLSGSPIERYGRPSVEGDSEQSALLTLGGRFLLARGLLRPYMEVGLGLGWRSVAEYSYERDAREEHTSLQSGYSLVTGVVFESEDSPVAAFLELDASGMRGYSPVTVAPLRLGLAFALGR